MSDGFSGSGEVRSFTRLVLPKVPIDSGFSGSDVVPVPVMLPGSPLPGDLLSRLGGGGRLPSIWAAHLGEWGPCDDKRWAREVRRGSVYLFEDEAVVVVNPMDFQRYRVWGRVVLVQGRWEGFGEGPVIVDLAELGGSYLGWVPFDELYSWRFRVGMWLWVWWHNVRVWCCEA